MSDIPDFKTPPAPDEGATLTLNPFWSRNDIQLPRLVAEIKAIGLTPEQMTALQASMDLTSEQLHELLDRGEELFESIKEFVDLLPNTCACCASTLQPAPAPTPETEDTE